jgi:hypothetical protein
VCCRHAHLKHLLLLLLPLPCRPVMSSAAALQVGGAFELLRPNVKDILYTLEVNTFKVGLQSITSNNGGVTRRLCTRCAA